MSSFPHDLPTDAAPSQLAPIAPEVWRMAAVVVLGAFMTLLDTTIVNVALRSIEQRLHSPLADTQWLITGYLLAVGATLPITGWATRRFGARRIFLTSLVLFTASSALCGISTSLPELIAFRVLQGIGGALILPVGQAALTKIAGPHNMPRMIGVVGGPMLLAPVLGPTIGGALIDGLSWRWIFFVNLPIGVIAVLAGLRYFIAEDSGREHAGRLDLLGLGLLSTGLVGLLYGISEVGVLNKISDAQVLVPFIAGAILCGAFLAHARHAARPLLGLTPYKDHAYALASIVMATGGAAMFGTLIVLPLFFQEIRGETAFHTGLMLMPQGIGAVTAMILTGRLTTRLGGGTSTIIGVVLAIVATVPFIFADAHTPYALLALLLVVRGLGLSLSIMPAMTAAIVGLRPDQVDDATAQLNVLQRVGGALGAAVLTVVLSRHLAELHPLTGTGAAHAFNTTWIWAVVITAAGVLPAVPLVRVERSHRQAGRKRIGRTEPNTPELQRALDPVHEAS
jgi:EmrB/QacA subfamily drug resistance transporter